MSNNSISSINDLIFYETELPKFSDFIVVLWNKWVNTMIDVKKIYDMGISKKIIITWWSYMGQANVKSEAEIFMEKWIELWINSNDIILETLSTNTKENIINIKEILEKNNFDFEKWKILFVCKAFHTRRVLMTSKQFLWNNISYYFYPIVDKNNISKEHWFKTDKAKKRVLEELVRIWNYTIKWDLSLK